MIFIPYMYRTNREFARQMGSPNLKKAATESKFRCIHNYSNKQEDLGKPGSEARLKAEFIDGSIWEIETKDFTNKDLRDMFFEKAADVEDAIERAGAEEDDDEEDEPERKKIKGTKKGKTAK